MSGIGTGSGGHLALAEIIRLRIASSKWSGEGRVSEEGGGGRKQCGTFRGRDRFDCLRMGRS